METSQHFGRIRVVKWTASTTRAQCNFPLSGNPLFLAMVVYRVTTAEIRPQRMTIPGFQTRTVYRDTERRDTEITEKDGPMKFR